jgi:hypothetical protein
MFEWLFGKKDKSPPTAVKAQGPSSSAGGDPGSEDPEELLAALPAETTRLLKGLPARLDAMVLTPSMSARAELEERNVSRRKIWGDQAVDVPIPQGDATKAMIALLQCLVTDHRLAEVTRVAVEEVPAPAPSEAGQVERARQQLEHMSPALKARYEKKLIKHMRKKDHTGTPSNGGIRKIVVTVYLRETFARHEILRIADDQFHVMVCAKR